MDYLIYQTKELEALNGLPHIQQLIYFAAIRPFIDFSTGIAGIRRRISHQGIKEAISVDSGRGIKSGSPSREQIRRAIKSLERSGLIIIQSDESHLILKCPLAIAHRFVQNKTDSIPTAQTDTHKVEINIKKSIDYESEKLKADIFESQETDTPNNSNNYYNIFLCEQFEKFWDLYPLKKSRLQAWEAFQSINPNDALAAQINSALQQQIHFHQQSQSLGQWVAAWKYPANWLTQRCWEDEVQIVIPQEKNNANHETNYPKQTVRDSFWESCKSGFESEAEPELEGNVIAFGDYRRKSQAY